MPILSRFSIELREKLAFRLTELRLGSDEVIVSQRERQEPFLYIVQKGRVEIYLEMQTFKRTYTKDLQKTFLRLDGTGFFGEVEFFT